MKKPKRHQPWTIQRGGTSPSQAKYNASQTYTSHKCCEPTVQRQQNTQEKLNAAAKNVPQVRIAATIEKAKCSLELLSRSCINEKPQQYIAEHKPPVKEMQTRLIRTKHKTKRQRVKPNSCNEPNQLPCETKANTSNMQIIQKCINQNDSKKTKTNCIILKCELPQNGIEKARCRRRMNLKTKQNWKDSPIHSKKFYKYRIVERNFGSRGNSFFPRIFSFIPTVTNSDRNIYQTATNHTRNSIQATNHAITITEWTERRGKRREI